MTVIDPRAPPISPTSSFGDLSDDEEGEYQTIMHSSSGRGVKLLFSKSKVYVHPTPSAKDNIPGFIALVQQKSPADLSSSSTSSSASKQSQAESYLLAWLPESSLGGSIDAYVKVDLTDASSPPRQTFLVPEPPTTTLHNASIGTYAFAVPVSEIYSLLIRPPSLGWWYGSVVINTRAGDSFPALFFHDDECQSTILQKKKQVKDFDPFGPAGGTFWGGDEILRWLRRYVTVEKSGADGSVFLINPTAEDKLGFGSPPSSPRSTSGTKAVTQGADGGAPSASNGSNRDAGMDTLTKALKQARWSFLEKMSQVTSFTRRTAQDIADNPRVPPQVKRLMKNPDVQTLSDEFDSARLYLARWAMGMAEQSERDRRQRIFVAQDVLEMEESDVGSFEILDVEASNMSLKEKREPLKMEEWKAFFNSSTGRLQVTVAEVKERIFLGGLDPSDGVRKEAWMFLLGVYPWDSTSDERRALISSTRDEFLRLKGAWWEQMVEGSGSTEDNEWRREQKARIEKDVHRTDRHITLFQGEDIPHPDPDSPFAESGTNVHMEQLKDMLLTYNEYNPSLGYVQGMSDLLSPIYAVMQDDALAFWGFEGFMQRMERNFLRDQSGMREQLLTLDQLVQLMDPALHLHLQSADSTNFFFFFRMLLVWFKREFSWPDTLRLWESLWTDYYSANFHLFIALAILEKHRDIIIQHLRHFDEVLKYINDLSGNIDLSSTLLLAQALFRRFQRTVEAIDKKKNFPAPGLRQRRPSNAAIERRRTGSNASASATASSKVATPALTQGQRRPDPKGKGSVSPPRETMGDPVVTNEREVQKTKEKIITPLLRALLSKEVKKLDTKVVEGHGRGSSTG